MGLLPGRCQWCGAGSRCHEADSDIETVARAETAEDFWFVAQAYGFADADAEKLIATRDW
jgi:hypothetical protein